MIALLIGMLLTSPTPPPRCVWWSRAEHRCRDADLEVIGPWDPRPAPGEWDRSAYLDPPAWGSYPTEKPAVRME